MHEAAIAQSILQIALQRALSRPGSKVERIRVRIGSFRNVDPDSLQFAFDGLKGDMQACAAAELEMHIVPAVALCLKRQHEYEPNAERGFRCPSCGSGIGELTAGEELDVFGCVLSSEEQTLCTK